MPNTPFQPTLPAPTALSDQELTYLDESPAGLFAENQNSNIGLKRKLFADTMAEVSDQIASIYAERFISTASLTLADWEKEVGLPISPNLSNQARQARITARKRTGPFTRQRRKDVVETYLLSTFGLTIQLFPQGTALVPAGLPLYSNATSLVGLYTITENITNFSYAVVIDPAAQIDVSGLTTELASITPAGISFTVSAGAVLPARTYGSGTYGSGYYGGA